MPDYQRPITLADLQLLIDSVREFFRGAQAAWTGLLVLGVLLVAIGCRMCRSKRS